MSLNLSAPLVAIESHAKASGLFERVIRREPLSAPGSGLTAAVWGQRLRPIALQSGLNVTSAAANFFFRVYAELAQEPAEDVDVLVFGALGDVMGRLTGDFTLGGTVSSIDLLNRHGVPMDSAMGYLTQDNKTFRTGTLLIPLIFNDVWEQVP